MRAQCPKTCNNKDGNFDCGEIKAFEGCFCKDGFVRSHDGDCIDVTKCPAPQTTVVPTTSSI